MPHAIRAHDAVSYRAKLYGASRGRLVCLAGALVCALLAVVGMSAAGPDVRVAAHRGGAQLWAENGLTAFRNALALGADYLELDTHLTADGEVVVIHDPTLERTTTGHGAVSAARLADLAAARLKARDGRVTDDVVPTLAQVLDTLAPSTAQLLLEIKVDTARKAYPDIERKALALVEARGLRDRVIVMAFEAPTLKCEWTKSAVIMAGQEDALAVGVAAVGVAQGRRLAAQIERPPGGVGGQEREGPLLVRVHQPGGAGLQVAAWTANGEADIKRLVELGVDVVISDRPDLALRLAGRPPRTP